MATRKNTRKNVVNSDASNWLQEAKKRMPAELQQLGDRLEDRLIQGIWTGYFRTHAHELSAPMQSNGKRAKARLLDQQDWDRAAELANQSLTQQDWDIAREQAEAQIRSLLS